MVQLGTTEALCFHHISDDIVHFKLKPSTHVHNHPIILQIEPIILKLCFLCLLFPKLRWHIRLRPNFKVVLTWVFPSNA